jgi:hypothetical protein
VSDFGTIRFHLGETEMNESFHFYRSRLDPQTKPRRIRLGVYVKVSGLLVVLVLLALIMSMH